MSAVTNSSELTSSQINMAEEVFVYPASYSQQGIWFLTQMDPSSSAYCIPFAYRMLGSVNIEMLNKSINEIVRRHEAFRTTFSFVGDAPVQVVTQQLVIDMPLIDLSALSDKEKEQELSRLLAEESTRTFNLGTGPLICASVIRLSEREHVLRLNIHHIILDHLSVVQFARELTELYESYVKGGDSETSPLTEPKLHYGDYSVWQKEWQSPEALKTKLEFWAEKRELLDTVLQLPTDSSRPVAQTFVGKEARISFPLPVIESLREFSRGEAVSMFIAMLAAYKILLYRYTGQSSISVGCPYANRGQQIELEEVMGCFINTLPLVNELSGALTFKDVLKLVRKSVFSVNAHQEVPFELIVEELHPTRNMSYNPMFQVGFMLQDPPMELTLEGLDVTSFKLHNESAKFDMMIWLWDSANGSIEGILEYNTDLWGDETINQFIEHYQTVLESIVKNPDQSIDELSVISEKEQHRLIVEWNDTRAEYTSSKGFHELISQQAAQSVDDIALICGTDQLSYRVLEHRSNQVAHYLIEAGVKTDSLVGICMERSAEMLVVLLGILKAGGAYLPLDPAFPTERLEFMLGDAKVALLLSESKLRDILPKTSATITCMDLVQSEIKQQSEKNPDVDVNPNDLAYVIYTSGSTGKPKGVQVPHGAVANFLTSMSREPGMGADDVLVAVTTLSFDIAVLELYLPLVVGGTTVIASREQASDGALLKELIEDTKATIMQATPTTWRLLIAAGWQGSKVFKILCGGEAMPRDLVGDLISRAGGAWNMYGPTETTVWSTCYKLTDPEAPILVGKPIDNTEIYILDERMKLVPTGVYGEIYIGGDGVTRGYLNREELTNERFVENNFSKAAKSKLYRTGDLGRYLADGNIEYQSRNDGQVKVRGFRIELGEIESSLAKYEAVAQGVVIVREDRPGDQRLVAYVVFTPGQSATITEIREHLKVVLPDYMIPQFLVALDELPMTPNGKIDRKSLPAPFASFDDDHVEPETDSEIYLAELWKEELGVERISIHDNFFDAGGHSLLSMMVIARIRKETGADLSPRLLLMESLGAIAEKNDFVINDNSATLVEDKPQIVGEVVDSNRDKSTTNLFGKLKKQFLKK